MKRERKESKTEKQLGEELQKKKKKKKTARRSLNLMWFCKFRKRAISEGIMEL